MGITPSSISKTGRTEPFELQLVRNQIPWHKAITIFGYNSDVDTAEETIWPYGGIMPHPATALSMKVSSDDADDNATGTGARTVFVEGLDANYNEISETVILNGQTAVLTVKSYIRINEAYVASAGTSNGAEGNIYFGTGNVTAGVPATVYDIIKFDYNTRVTGHYTVPAGYTAYMDAGSITVGQTGTSNPVSGRLVVTGTNNIRINKAIVTLNTGNVPYPFLFPLQIPEKTDIEAVGQGGGTNNRMSSYFNIVLVKNDGAL
jgi:hypothetical protein